MSQMVRLRLGDVVFEVEKSVLLRFDRTFFYGLLSSGAWQPDADGAYFVDRPALGFDRILEYLRSGELSVDGLGELEEECLYSSLDYFLIPYKRQWKYNTQLVIEGFRAQNVCELKDGRLCGAYGKDIIVWNVDTSVIEMTLNGHTGRIHKVIQLQDGRVCSCSEDHTIKLWSIDSGLCELTLTGHSSDVRCIIQLFDGRVCSCTWDNTIRVWNLSTGICEMIIHTPEYFNLLVQLLDGRICCGFGRIISIYSILTGECELSWEGNSGSSNLVNAIVCIDSARVCSGSRYGRIKVWSVATGERLRTIEAHDTGAVNSMVLMQNGRLCSASHEGTLKLWNLETGECEKTLSFGDDPPSVFGPRVLQLQDGRLLCAVDVGLAVLVWS